MVNHRKVLSSLFTIVVCIILFNISLFAQPSNSLVRAGLRSSVYGINPFPSNVWWENVAKDMANRYNGTSPAVIWILGYTTSNGCFLNFQNPNPDSSYSKIYFSQSDKHESYLNYFDDHGVKVWLQVEPGNADINTLIDLVLTKYSHHECIVGFGVDVEWYKTGSTYPEGKAVTDEEAQGWVERIRSYNENYLLFTKHWLVDKMPPTYRDGMVFVDDSQIFSNMTSMIDEFEDWSNAFSDGLVAFQYGYDSDKTWWQNLNDPPKDIGDAILAKCPNVSGLFWVDFTAYDIWDANFEPTSIRPDDIPIEYQLSQNYPNPFNPSTTISYSIVHDAHVVLSLYDVTGQKLMEDINNYQSAGSYNYKLDMSNYCSGVYYYSLSVNGNIITKKMCLIK